MRPDEELRGVDQAGAAIPSVARGVTDALPMPPNSCVPPPRPDGGAGTGDDEALDGCGLETE